MLAVGESSLIDWRHFDTELLSYHEEDGHHLEARGRDLTGYQQFSDGNLLLFSTSFSFT